MDKHPAKIETTYCEKFDYWTASILEFDGNGYVVVNEDAEGATEAEAIADAEEYIALFSE